jgi:hypothetical protein
VVTMAKAAAARMAIAAAGVRADAGAPMTPGAESREGMVTRAGQEGSQLIEDLQSRLRRNFHRLWN